MVTACFSAMDSHQFTQNASVQDRFTLSLTTKLFSIICFKFLNTSYNKKVTQNMKMFRDENSVTLLQIEQQSHDKTRPIFEY